MTPSEKLDRLERLARLLCERPLHPSGVSGKQAASLGNYVTALGEYDVARQALAAKPDDSEMKETLCRAGEVLDRAREELKRQSKNQPRRLPA